MSSHSPGHKTVGELKATLSEYYVKKHIGNVRYDDAASRIEVTGHAEGWAGAGAQAGLTLPIRVGKLQEARELLEKMMHASAPPSQADVQALFEMIDPVGQ